MVRKVILSDRSIADLKAICDRVAEDNPVAARKLGRDLFKATARLGDFPKSGRFYTRLGKRDLFELICRGYRIFYVIDGNSDPVEIRHIRHGARGEPAFAE
ncbi:MAG: type II toxin-antitoxin system RelE/ParE family toxin [Symploca sp. SIO2D2]|nr:type II toxin-antitoxin system RelE/ParE family toxin [Symploca sp. SIO2D2]